MNRFHHHIPLGIIMGVYIVIILISIFGPHSVHGVEGDTTPPPDLSTTLSSGNEQEIQTALQTMKPEDFKDPAKRDMIKQSITGTGENAKKLRSTIAQQVYKEGAANSDELRSVFLESVEGSNGLGAPKYYDENPQILKIWADHYGERGDQAYNPDPNHVPKKSYAQTMTDRYENDPEAMKSAAKNVQKITQYIQDKPESGITNDQHNNIVQNLFELKGKKLEILEYPPAVDDGTLKIAEPIVEAPHIEEREGGEVVAVVNGETELKTLQQVEVNLDDKDISEISYGFEGTMEHARSIKTSFDNSNILSLNVNGEDYTFKNKGEGEVVIPLEGPRIGEAEIQVNGNSESISVQKADEEVHHLVTDCKNCVTAFNLREEYPMIVSGSGEQKQHFVDDAYGLDIDVDLGKITSEVMYKDRIDSEFDLSLTGKHLETVSGIVEDGKDALVFNTGPIKEGTLNIGRNVQDERGQPQILGLITTEPSTEPVFRHIGAGAFTPEPDQQILIAGGFEQGAKPIEEENPSASLGREYSAYIKQITEGKKLEFTESFTSLQESLGTAWTAYTKNKEAGTLIIDNDDVATIANTKIQGPSYNDFGGDTAQVNAQSTSPDTYITVRTRDAGDQMGFFGLGEKFFTVNMVGEKLGPSESPQEEALITYQEVDKKSVEADENNAEVEGTTFRVSRTSTDPQVTMEVTTEVPRDIHGSVSGPVDERTGNHVYISVEAEDDQSIQKDGMKLTIGQGLECDKQIKTDDGKTVGSVEKTEKAVVGGHTYVAGRENTIASDADVYTMNGEFTLGRQSKALGGADRKVLLHDQKDTGLRIDDEGRIYSKLGIHIGDFDYDPSQGKYVANSRKGLIGDLMSDAQEDILNGEQAGLIIKDQAFFARNKADWRDKSITIMEKRSQTTPSPQNTQGQVYYMGDEEVIISGERSDALFGADRRIISTKRDGKVTDTNLRVDSEGRIFDKEQLSFQTGELVWDQEYGRYYAVPKRGLLGEQLMTLDEMSLFNGEDNCLFIKDPAFFAKNEETWRNGEDITIDSELEAVDKALTPAPSAEQVATKIVEDVATKGPDQKRSLTKLASATRTESAGSNWREGKVDPQKHAVVGFNGAHVLDMWSMEDALGYFEDQDTDTLNTRGIGGVDKKAEESAKFYTAAQAEIGTETLGRDVVLHSAGFDAFKGALQENPNVYKDSFVMGFGTTSQKEGEWPWPEGTVRTYVSLHVGTPGTVPFEGKAGGGDTININLKDLGISRLHNNAPRELDENPKLQELFWMGAEANRRGVSSQELRQAIEQRFRIKTS